MTTIYRIECPVIRAISVAVRLHDHHLDKAGDPYLLHLLRVLDRVRAEVGENWNWIQQAAVLHDAIEDTVATADELIEAGVHTRAVKTVQLLTRTDGMPYDDYITRIATDTSLIGSAARTIKQADLDDNLDLARLARLPGPERDRLSAKYNRAKLILATAPD